MFLNNSSFLPGFGDGGENLFNRDSIYDTSTIYNELEENAEKDKERKQIIEARNEGDSLAYSTEKQVEEHGDKLSDEDKEAIKTATSDLRLALDNENVGSDEIN